MGQINEQHRHWLSTSLRDFEAVFAFPEQTGRDEPGAEFCGVS
jgi:hypothetical protein